jgi:hypothetical protein
MFLTSALQGARSMHRYLTPLDSSRWVHFLVYAAVVALPMAAWQRRRNIVLSFAAPIMSIALEASLGGIPLPQLRMQTLPADLFGISAGVLLGLNFRMMRRSARRAPNEGLESSHLRASDSQFFASLRGLFRTELGSDLRR